MKDVEPDRAASVAFVGRAEFLAALVAALRSAQSRLITGPPGCGKTRLLTEALRASSTPFVLVPQPRVLHDLLLSLAVQLDCRSARYPDLRRATTLHLKPLVENALRAAPRAVVVEDISEAGPRMYRFLQDVYYIPGACLIVTARSRERLGHLHKLFWDPREEIALKPLPRHEASLLFDLASRAFPLAPLDLDEFRRKVLPAAKGNPGQIVEMCRLAAQPGYQHGRHIKFLPLRIDVLSRFAR
jgi:hypothetical protein